RPVHSQEVPPPGHRPCPGAAGAERAEGLAGALLPAGSGSRRLLEPGAGRATAAGAADRAGRRSGAAQLPDRPGRSLTAAAVATPTALSGGTLEAACQLVLELDTDLFQRAQGTVVE